MRYGQTLSKKMDKNGFKILTLLRLSVIFITSKTTNRVNPNLSGFFVYIKQKPEVAYIREDIGALLLERQIQLPVNNI